MNAWIVQIGEPLPIDSNARKMRDALLIDELIKRGHKVVWWASAFDHIQKRWIFDKDTTINISDSFTIHAIKGCVYKNNISIKRFLNQIIIYYKLKNRFKKEPKPDFIKVDIPVPEYAGLCARYAKKHNIPFIVDVRDYWPDEIVDRLPLPKLISRSLLWYAYKNLTFSLKTANSIVAMSYDCLNWGLKYADRSIRNNDKCFYLGYSFPKDNCQISEEFKILLDSLRSKFLVVFLGNVGHASNPSIVVQIAERLRSNNDIYFVIAGNGPLLNIIKENSEKYTNITFTNYINKIQIDALLKISKIGLCTSSRRANFFPGKSFMYSAYGLPILNAFEGDLFQIIDSYKIGFNYMHDNVDELTNYIKLLYTDAKLYKEMSMNSLKLFEREFNGEKIYKEFADHIEEILEKFNKKD